MIWFDGSVADAVRLVRERSLTLIVFIRGDDETSKLVDELFDEEVASVCQNFIALRLDASSEATAQFSAVYAVLTVPCVYLIAPNGRALDVKLGALEKSNLIEWIKEKAKAGTSSTSDQTSAQGPSDAVEGIPTMTATTSDSGPQVSAPKADSLEPCDSSKPLEDRVTYAKQMLEAKRRIQAEEDKKKAIEAELTRRQAGKTLQEFKERERAMEIEEAMAQRRRDEVEDRLLREKLRRQIEDDRRAKAERAGMINLQNDEPSIPRIPSPLLSPVTTANRVDSDQVRLQLRLIEGGHVVGKFHPNDTLAGEVRNLLDGVSHNTPIGNGELPVVSDQIRMKLLNLSTRGYRFRRLHPAKLFEPEEESQSLASLGISSSAVLVLVPTGGDYSNAVQSSNSGGWISQLYGLIRTGATTFFDYTFWIVNGFYRVGSGIVSFIIPNRTNDTHPRSSNTDRSASDNKGAAPAVNRAIRRQGNMARLSHLPDNSDDEQARWNGNSTEQL